MYRFEELYDLYLETPLPFGDSEVDNIHIIYDKARKVFKISLFNNNHFVEDTYIE